MNHPQPSGYPVQPVQTQVLVQPYRCSTASPYASYAPEPTQVDPFGSEPTQELPRSPWEPDHRR